MKELPQPFRTETLDTSYAYVWVLGAAVAVFIVAVVVGAVIR